MTRKSPESELTITLALQTSLKMPLGNHPLLRAVCGLLITLAAGTTAIAQGNGVLRETSRSPRQQPVRDAKAAPTAAKPVAAPKSDAAVDAPVLHTEKTPIRYLNDPAAAATGSRGGLFSTSVLLFCLVAGAGGVSYLAKKRAGGASGSLPPSVFQILGRHPAGTGKSMMLVRLGQRILLVSSSSDGMRTLTEIEDPAEVARITSECIAAAPLPFISLGRGQRPLKKPPAPAPLHVADETEAYENIGRRAPMRPETTPARQSLDRRIVEERDYA